MDNRVQASCHCGDLRFVLSTERATADLPYRVCRCDHCSRRRPIYTSDPAGTVAFDLAPGASLLRYRFSTATADFISCARCGCLAAALCLIDDEPFAVLNATLFIDRPTTQPSTIDAEGESPDTRTKRRARTWTPVTRPPTGWPG